MRNKEIDFLRFFGLSLIIFAHVNPPEPLFQIRNFDVPLMVLLSGMSYSLSQKEPVHYRTYLIKRFKRLVLPVWTFLTLYFLISFALKSTLDNLNLSTIISSYALITGIGYLWIIRVFLLVALLSPKICNISNRITSNRAYILILITGLSIYEGLVVSLNQFDSNIVFHTSTLFVYYAIAYGCIFSLGIRILNFSQKDILSLILISVLFTIGFAWWQYSLYNKVIYIKSFKYPPRLYYLSYGIFSSLICWLIVNSKVFCRFLSSLTQTGSLSDKTHCGFIFGT